MWPRRSWLRSLEYFKKRVVRLSASPHAIALGFAAGAFASCTPFVGFHFLIAAAIAFLLGGNLIASAIGTAVGNPLTFPFIWATTFNIGRYILPAAKASLSPGPMSHHFFSQSIETILPIISRMLIGAVPLGIVVGAVCYFVVRSLTAAYQEARRRRLRQRTPLGLKIGAAEGMDPV